jgi:hypothetical protein
MTLSAYAECRTTNKYVILVVVMLSVIVLSIVVLVKGLKGGWYWWQHPNGSRKVLFVLNSNKTNFSLKVLDPITQNILRL